nr:hypothetical protein [Tanacetum cinerariifolium]
MLLLFVQGKLTNLTVKERFAFNVSLRMFTRSIVIQRRVEDLQLGNKDKKNRLIRIDELHKFSDGTLTDVRTALDDHLKGIRMQYLPQSIWRKSDKDKAAAMIQAIDKRLKTKRIMRNLERSILTDLQVTPTKPGRMTKPNSSHNFIANCFNVGNIKMEVKFSFLLFGIFGTSFPPISLMCVRLQVLYNCSMAFAIIYLATEEEDKVVVPNAPTPPSPTTVPSPPP